MNAATFCRRSEGKVVSLNLWEEHQSPRSLSEKDVMRHTYHD